MENILSEHYNKSKQYGFSKEAAVIINASPSDFNILDIQNTITQYNNILTHIDNETEIDKILDKFAKESFRKEIALYNQINPALAREVEKAYDGQRSDYLTKRINDISLGEAITGIFYGYNVTESKKGTGEDYDKFKIIQILSTLDTKELIKNAEANTREISKMMIKNQVNYLFRSRVDEYKDASTIKFRNSENKELIQLLFNERILVEDKASLADRKKGIGTLVKTRMKGVVQKMLAKGIGRSSPEFKTTIPQEEKKATQETTDQLDIYIHSVIAEYFANELYRNFSAMLPEGNKPTIEDFITLFKDAVTIKRRSAAGGVALASYEVDDKKVDEFLNKYMKNQAEEDKQQLQTNINRDMLSSEEKNTLDMLSFYHNSIKKYISGRGGNPTVYENFFEKLVTQEVLQDLKGNQQVSTAISAMNSEIENAQMAMMAIQERSQTQDFLQQLSNSLDIDSKWDDKKIDEIIASAYDKGMIEVDNKKVGVKEYFKTKNKKEILNMLIERIEYQKNGFVSTYNGSLGEIFITALLRAVKVNTAQTGRERNLMSQQAHYDTLSEVIDQEGRKQLIGIQSKVYNKNNISLYKNTTVNFSSEAAARYLETGALEAFRWFLLNNTFLSSLNDVTGFPYTDNDFQNFLILRLNNFIRYTDQLSSIENVGNNFYLINFNIVPASVIFLKLKELFSEDKNFKDMIVFTGSDKVTIPNDQEPEYYEVNNLLGKLKPVKATFKSFTLDLSRLGVEVFK